MKELTIAVVGATGAVGQEILKVMEERKIPYKELRLLASARSAGTQVEYQGKTYTVQETTENSFDDVNLDGTLNVLNLSIVRFPPVEIT